MSRNKKPGGPAMDSREEFLARWSRRKLDVQRDSQEVLVNETAAVTPPKPPAVEQERELTDADMPPIETLDEDSDFSPFLSPGVSDDLRQQALRKLFAQPAYNMTDGLNDYDEDFTQFTGLGKVITHEMKRMLQRELEAETATTESADVTAAQAGDTEVPADDVTAAAETGNTDHVETSTKNDDPGKGDVSSS